MLNPAASRHLTSTLPGASLCRVTGLLCDGKIAVTSSSLPCGQLLPTGAFFPALRRKAQLEMEKLADGKKRIVWISMS